MKNNKGFILTETLFVSVVVISILLGLYIQLKKLNDNNYKTLKYNQTNDIMILESLGKYLYETNLLDNDFDYINITDCTYSTLTSKEICSYLVSIAEIDKLIISKNDLSKLKNNMNSLGLSNEFKDYISSIKNTYDKNGYRLLAYFSNGSSANIVIKG